MLALGTLPTSGALASRFDPVLDVESRYDDNVLRQKHGEGDYITVVTPELWWRGESPSTRFELGGRRRFYSDSRSGTMRAQTDAALLGLDHSLSEVSRVNLDYQYQRSRDPLAFEPATRIVEGDGRTRMQRGHASFDAWRGKLDYRYGNWAYEDSGLTDATSHRAEAQLYLTRTGVNSWLAVYRREDYEIENRGSLSSNMGTLGLRRQISEKVSAQAEAGVVQRDLGDGGETQNELAGAFDISASTASPIAPITLRARAKRQLANTGDFELSRGGFGINWSVGWERVLDAEGGNYQDPVLSERWSAGARDTLFGGSVLSLRGSYGRAHSIEAGGRRTRLYRAVAGYSMPLFRWLTQKTEYEFVQQGASGSSEPVEFRRNRFSFSLRAALPY